MDRRVCCLVVIYDNFFVGALDRQASWLIDLNPGILGKEPHMRCDRVLILILERLEVLYLVSIGDGQCELWTRPCALLGCTTKGYRL